MRDAAFTEGGRHAFDWVKFKFNQCMFDMWHNGTQLCLLNSLILRDCVNCVMMGLHRALQQTKNNSSKNLNTKHSHAVTPLFMSTSPCLSSIPSLCSVSPSSSSNPVFSINPLELFTAVDLGLESLSVHKQSDSSQYLYSFPG